MKLSANLPISPRMLGVGAVIILALVIPLMLQDSPFYLHIIIMIALFAFFGQAWNIVGGVTGLLAVNQAALFGIGAYTSTMLQVWYGVNPWLGMLLGAFLSVLLAFGFTYPAIRLRGLFLAIASIAFSEALRILFLNWREVGGAIGVFVPLQPESLIHFQWHFTKLPYCYIMLSLLLLETLFINKILKSKTGYFFIAIREDEVAAAHLGINVTKYKLIAMAISAFLSAIAGSFYAQYILFIEPRAIMSLSMIFQAILIAIIGGLGTLIGPVVGSLIIIPTAEYSRILFGGSLYSGVAFIVYGVVLMVVAIAAPAGVIGEARKVYGWIKQRWQKRKV